MQRVRDRKSHSALADEGNICQNNVKLNPDRPKQRGEWISKMTEGAGIRRQMRVWLNVKVL